MFLVVPDPAHGLVAAPQSSRDLTPGTVEYLTAHGFAWNEEIEAYTCRADDIPAAVDRITRVLRGLGHHVLSSWGAVPRSASGPD
ncbi:hypothetical protein [Streptomyces sp. NPDC085932]|uniref:hypothetical protein n=1 Tax=Streptomyces sp. NPDC085932 TaxID=3365741 RepID=UPI0037CF1C3A